VKLGDLGCWIGGGIEFCGCVVLFRHGLDYSFWSGLDCEQV
jgi:hypothetical protein